MPAERELADDAMWKIIQKNTFTRWANEHLKTAKMTINDLERDLSDGLRLIALIEVLSGKKFQKFNKRPTFRTQKFENVTVSLKFLEETEGIKIVNIDSSDIVDQKLKLIMGLIWTLILHYSISMPMWEDEDPNSGKDQTPKQRLLAWIQSKIPEKNITNFTSDWNDGTAIAALVEALAPGLCPDWPQFNPKESVKNAKKAMDAAEKWMDVPQLIRPEEMCNPKVDELSMMTYLSRFPHAKPKAGAPLQTKPNPARVRAYGPGLEPTGNVVGAPARFTVETIGAGNGEVEVTVLNPKGTAEKCEVIANNDRLLSYSCIYVPSVEGQYKVTIKFAHSDIPKCPYLVAVGKPGDPKKVVAAGPGIEKTGVQVNRKTYFEVTTKNCGDGVVDVGIVDPQGKKNTVRAVITKKSTELWYVEYTALISGLHSVNVFFAGKAVPNSPFAVGVSTEGGARLDPSKLGKPVECTPLEAAQATLATPLKAAAAPPSSAPADDKPKDNGPAKKPAPDAKRCYATGRGIQPKGVRVGDQADIKIFTEGAGGGNGDPRVLVMGPGGMAVKNTLTKVGTYYTCVYSPTKPGLYIVTITYSGQQIQKSPFKVEVGPIKMLCKVRASGPGLETGVVGQPALFKVEPNGEPGQLGLRVEGPSQARLEPTKNPDGTMDVAYYPTEPGEYAVHVLVNGEDIPKSPFMADIKGSGEPTAAAPAASAPVAAAPAAPAFDPSKVVAFGPGLQERGVKVSTWAEFTVDASKAGGTAPLSVTVVDAEKNNIEVKITDNKNGIYTCRYMAKKSIQHTITITYGGTQIPKSPFKVNVEGGVSADKVKVYGPALEQPVKTFVSTYLIVDCKEAGVGNVKVTLTDEKGTAIPFKLVDNKDKTYRVEFQASVVGVLTASITFANQPTSGSPYKINVITSLDISKVEVKGLPEHVTVGKEVPFEIITAGAGKGQAKVSISSPSGKPVPSLVTAKTDGYNCKFIPLDVGQHSVQVTFADQPVPKSPFAVTAADVNKVKVYGPAVEAPVKTFQTSYLIVDCKEAGQGPIEVTLTDEQGVNIPVKVIDNKDKTYRVEFEATVVGILKASVTFLNQPTPGSPYKITVESPTDLSKVQVKGLPENATVGKPVPFDIITAGAGKGQAKVNVNGPSGKPVPCLVLEKPEAFAAKFTPVETGPHTVQVTFADQPVPNSPFKVNATAAADVSKVKVYGPAVEAPVKTYQLTYLIVDCKEAGQGEVQVTLTNEQGATIPVKITDNKDQTYRVEFEATVAGTYSTNVTFANQLTPGSPYKITVESSANKVKVTDMPQNVPVGKEATFNANTVEAGPGEPRVTVTSPSGSTVPSAVERKPDGFTGKYTPVEVGPHKVDVLYANQPIPGSPFQVTATEASRPDKVKVYGPAIEAPVKPKTPTYATIDCTEAGVGEVHVTLTNEEGISTLAKIIDNHDKTFRVEFETSSVGIYNLNVNYSGQTTPNSPYKIRVEPGVDVSKVRVTELPENAPIGKEVAFNVATVEAGPGPVKVNVTSPTGKAVPTTVEEQPNGFTGKFTPVEEGPHKVDVTFSEQPVPNSPFQVNAVPPLTVGDPAKVKVYGPGLTSGTVNKPAEFTIDTREAGPGGLGLTIDGPTEAKIECFDKGGGLFEVCYYPTEPGEYTTNVLFDDKPVPNSPFTAQINPAKMVDVSGIKVYGYGIESTGVFLESTSDFTVDATSVEPKGEGTVKALITAPSGTLTEALVKNQKNGLYQCLYTPFEQGPHKIDITYEGLKIPNSPFTVGVVPGCDPSRVKVYGPGLEKGEVNKPQTFTIETRGAGQGGIGLSVVGPTEPKIGCVDNHDGTLTVEYIPSSVGTYEIGVTFAEQPVPGSPFHADVTETSPATNVKCYGAGIEPKAVQCCQKAVFTVDASQSPVKDAPVEVTTTNTATGLKKPAEVTPRGNSVYDVSYTPDTEGPVKVDVSYAGYPVPNSPFTTDVQPSSVNPQKVKVSGSGVKPTGVPASLPVSFTVDTREAGKAPLDVIVKNSHGELVKAVVQTTEEGTYTVSYTPEEIGEYTVDVTYAGQEVPNAPFKVTTVATGDAKQVTVTDTVQSFISVNEESTVTIKKTEFAGIGRITCQVTNTKNTSIKFEATVTENQDGTVTIKYTPTEPGVYTLDIKFGGVSVTDGLITQEAVIPEETIVPVKKTAPEESAPVLGSEQFVPVTPVERAPAEELPETPVQLVPAELAPATQAVVEEQLVPVEELPIQAAKKAPQQEFSPFGRKEQPVPVVVPTEEIPSKQVPVQKAPTEGAPAVEEEALTASKKAPRQEFSPFQTQAPVEPHDQELLPEQYEPDESQPTPFHTADFCVPIGPDFDLVTAVVTTPTFKKHKPRVTDNKNGTVKVNYKPTEVGPHTLELNYAGTPLQGSPYQFNVQPKTPGQVSVYGSGLSSGLAGQPTSFTVVTKDAGPGGLGLSIEGPSKAEIQCTDNKDGTVTISYTPTLPGEYKITVKYGGQPISGSPYFAKISAPYGEEPAKSQVTLGSTNTMSLTVTESDLTNLTATIKRPSGSEEPCGLRRQPNGQLGISFTPKEVGDHWVSVFRNGQPIQGSPFKIVVGANEIGNASKVRVGGRGLTAGMANELNEFFVNTRDAGVGGLGLSVEGPGKVDIKCFENPGGTCRVAYKPTEPGTYQLSIKYADEHIPGSPFTVNIGGQPSGRVTERITRQQQAVTQTSSIGTVCELNITMAGIDISKIEASVVSPSGSTEPCEVIDLGNGRFTIKFVPKEMGVHTVSLKHNGLHIPGSPFQFTVGPIAGGGPHKVRAVGSGLERGEVNKPNPFTIITREAGAGGLSLGIEGPSKAVIDFQDRRDGTSDVTYTVTEPGEYLITVKFNDQPIPDSPFKVYILPAAGDSKKLLIHDLQQLGVQVNTATQFTVDFNGAQGKLDAKVIAPSGTETEANVQQVLKERYTVNFVPKESGLHFVHVRLNGVHVPGSPYPVQVGQLDADAGKVRAYGDGLYKGFTGQLCKFIVNTSNAGSGALSVGITGPSKVELVCREVTEGYEFSYTPLAPGDYLIVIKYAGTHVPGSPFKARIEGPGAPSSMVAESRMVIETVTKTTTATVSQVSQTTATTAALTPDASKVLATGNGLQRATVNQETSFIVDGSQTGFNMLIVGIAGPQIPCEQLHVLHMGRLKYVVKYQLSQPGNYTLMVKWGDQHIRGSPFSIVAQ